MNRKIAILDSGFGGVKTLEHLKKLLPNEDYILLKDESNYPYGTKTARQLKEILEKNISYLSSLNVKVIVVACNTAGTQLEFMKTLTDIPILEPISATTEFIKSKKEYDQAKILLLATNLTIKRGEYKKRLKDYRLISVKAQQLVSLAENNVKDDDVISRLVKKGAGADLIVLGCTHFGCFSKEIKEISNCKEVIESSLVLAKRVKDFLKENNLLSTCGNSNTFLITRLT